LHVSGCIIHATEAVSNALIIALAINSAATIKRNAMWGMGGPQTSEERPAVVASEIPQRV